jgi:hypothetical protein
VRVRVIADDERHLAIELASVPAVEQIGQAVVELGDEDRHARLDAGELQLPAHVVLGGHRREGLREAVQPQIEARQVPLHPHQEQPRLAVLVLVGMQDVGVVPVEKIGDGGDQTLAVGAGDEEDGGVAHQGSGIRG